MTTNLFLSYSRRETLFISDMHASLEKKGFSGWLDYLHILPGLPWQAQIDAAIKACDTLVLVVSKASMESPNVRREWGHAIVLKKRIVLAVFEAQPIPEPLQGLEWVDFRDNFDGGIKQLIGVISRPPQPPVKEFPTSGFRMPLRVWGVVAASIVTGILSIPAFYSLVIPFYLVPLPYQILKRQYDYFRVGFSVIVLPIVLFFSAMLFVDYFPEFFIITSFFSLIWAPIFFLLLQSRALRRWVYPFAARPNPIPAVKIKTPSPASLRFGIDYAVEDGHYADDFIQQMEAEGHHYVLNDQPIDAAFVFISQFKKETIYDINSQIVYPVILQNTTDVPRELQRLQWMDFRRGLRNVQALARLLYDPVELLKVLGIVPLGNQVVMPYIVQMMIYLLTVVAVFSVTGWIPTLLFIDAELVHHPNFAGFLIYSLAVIGVTLSLIIVTIQALIKRSGWLASKKGLFFAYLGLFFLGWMAYGGVGFQMELLGGNAPKQVIGPALGPISFVLGSLVILVMLPFTWRDLNRWLPAKNKK